MTKTTKRLAFATVGGLLGAAFALGGGCGGSTDGSRTGTGGATGAGGATGTGGRAGTGGAVGSGGSTGTGGASTTISCTPGVSPAMPLLSDFATGSWSATTGKWGMANNLTGSIFSFHGPGVATLWNPTAVTTEALVLSGNVDSGDYAGGGMSFDSCVNTTAYTGIQFTLGGTTAGCDLYFQVQTFSQQSTTNHGGCVTPPGPCYAFPKVKVTFGTTPITIHFSDLLTGTGAPATGVSKEMLGLQWQLQSPPPPDSGLQVSCGNISLTIDDVKFVN